MAFCEFVGNYPFFVFPIEYYEGRASIASESLSDIALRYSFSNPGYLFDFYSSFYSLFEQLGCPS